MPFSSEENGLRRVGVAIHPQEKYSRLELLELCFERESGCG
jgi:hypothetical protein